MFVSLFSANLAYVRPFYCMSVSPLPSFPCLFLLTSLWMVYSSTDVFISCTRFVTNIEFFNFILKYFLVLLKNYCVTFYCLQFHAWLHVFIWESAFEDYGSQFLYGYFLNFFFSTGSYYILFSWLSFGCVIDIVFEKLFPGIVWSLVF